MDDFFNNQGSTPAGNEPPKDVEAGAYNQAPQQPQAQPVNNPAPQQTPTPQPTPVQQPRVQQPPVYQPVQKQNSGYYIPPNGNGNYYQPNNMPPQKPQKPKNRALIVTIIIVVVCAIIAVAALGISATGKINNSNSSSSTVSDDAQAKIEDSESAALKDGSGNYTVAGVAQQNMDSCVLISVYTTQSAYSNFYGYGSQYGSSSSGSSSSQLSGEGSGVIMSESNGKTYIITCAHVISDGTTFKVTTNDGTEYDATMVGADSQTDIGVLSINATGLKVASFGDSNDIVVGEQCVAIGCPGGSKFMNSVATGIVSALDRPVSSSIGYNNECIQTDTAINPGNSGGALFNMQGQVIGINSSKIASTEYEGMGFAVPSNTAIETANSLIKNGYVEGRAKLGITYAPITKASNASAILSALSEKGYKDASGTMIVYSVDSSSNLNSKDVKQYDMIVAVDGETLTSTDILTSKLSKSSPGDTVKLTIARIENNQINTFEVDCVLIESKD